VVLRYGSARFREIIAVSTKQAVIEHLKICRLDHWLKNIFIVFGHAVAVVLIFDLEFKASMIGTIILSLIPACFIASANYILNEILDAPFDRQHPTKKLRGVAAGKVSVPILWAMKVAFIIIGFTMAWLCFENPGYIAALGLLLLSGFVYNIPPVRLKDRAYLDVIAESFNNPIRLWLGWYALVPANAEAAAAAGVENYGWYMPPMAIMLAWWFFGALLMTGKRYAEFRFIGNAEQSGLYRESFKVYTQRRLIIAMITYANLFCFCTGVALTDNEEMRNLILAFPAIIVAVIAYFKHAMSEVGAKLEPEQLLRKPAIIFATLITVLIAIALLYAHKTGVLHSDQILKWL
jgi:decaprenyl-phosphate phosphoribosyltransferase